jgi:hypothetical protein
VDPDTGAFAWQAALVSRKVVVLFAESPDWHLASAGASENTNALATTALLTSNAVRCRPISREAA